MSLRSPQAYGQAAVGAATMCEYIIVRWERKKCIMLNVMKTDITGDWRVKRSCLF